MSFSLSYHWHCNQDSSCLPILLPVLYPISFSNALIDSVYMTSRHLIPVCKTDLLAFSCVFFFFSFVEWFSCDILAQLPEDVQIPWPASRICIRSVSGSCSFCSSHTFLIHARPLLHLVCAHTPSQLLPRRAHLGCVSLAWRLSLFPLSSSVNFFLWVTSSLFWETEFCLWACIRE